MEIFCDQKPYFQPVFSALVRLLEGRIGVG